MQRDDFPNSLGIQGRKQKKFWSQEMLIEIVPRPVALAARCAERAWRKFDIAGRHRGFGVIAQEFRSLV